jgi:hypothetical protein
MESGHGREAVPITLVSPEPSDDTATSPTNNNASTQNQRHRTDTATNKISV